MVATVLPMSEFRRPFLRVLSSLWLVLVTGSVGAQAPEESFIDELEVRDVRIDVVVSGSAGYPVLGLTQGDFELLVDGQPTPISQFVAFESESALRIEGSNPGRRTPLQADERLFVTVLIDRTFLAPGDLSHTVDLLREFLTTLKSRDRVMLVTADPRAELLEPFESGPPRNIIDTLDDLVDRPGSGRSFVTDYRDLLDELGPQRNYGSQAEHRAKATLARVEAFAAEGQLRMQRVAANLDQLIRQMAGLPGRRVLVYAGGRIPIGMGQELLGAWEQSYGENSSFARLPEGEGGLDADSETMLFKTAPRVPSPGDDRELFAGIIQHANLAQVVLVPVDGGRSRTGVTSRRGGLGSGRGSSAVAGANSLMLADFANSTGGRVLAAHGSDSRVWEPLTRELANFYRLTFSPSRATGKPAYEIEVRLRPERPGVEIRHPAAVAFPSLDQEAIDRIRAALVLGAEHNVLGIDLEVLGVEHGDFGTKASIRVRVPMPNLALVPSGEHHLGRLTLFALAADWDGLTSAPVKAVVPIRLSTDELLTALAGPVALTVEILLPRGADSVGVGVRDHFASQFSTTVVELPSAP